MRSDKISSLVKPSTGGAGSNGLSAYEVAVANGFVGTQSQWLLSLKGTDGTQGIKGDKGDAGAQGIQGIQGVAGTNGTNGTNGVGVPVGGTTGQVLSKIDGTNYNTQWTTPSSGGGGLTYIIAIMTATQANSTTTVANVTELKATMEANAVYQVNCFVTFQSAATTTGAYIGFTSPTGCRCMVEVVVPITSTAVASQLRTIFPNATTATNTGSVLATGVTAINSNHTARISGIIRNGATAGDFQIQFRSEVASSAITLQIGSELQLIKIA